MAINSKNLLVCWCSATQGTFQRRSGKKFHMPETTWQTQTTHYLNCYDRLQRKPMGSTTDETKQQIRAHGSRESGTYLIRGGKQARTQRPDWRRTVLVWVVLKDRVGLDRSTGSSRKTDKQTDRRDKQSSERLELHKTGCRLPGGTFWVKKRNATPADGGWLMRGWGQNSLAARWIAEELTRRRQSQENKQARRQHLTFRGPKCKTRPKLWIF